MSHAIRFAATRLSDVRAVRFVGYCAIFVTCVTFGAWSVTAPISSAAIAPGRVIALGRNVSIKHVSGGTVAKIFKREGDHISEGQQLLSLDTTLAAADLEKCIEEQIYLRVRADRLTAELRGQMSIQSDADTDPVSASHGVQYREALAKETEEFSARLNKFKADQTSTQSQIVMIDQVIGRLTDEGNAMDQQLAIMDSDTQARDSLIKRGLMPQLNATDSRRIMTGIVIQKASLTADIAEKQSQREIAQHQLVSLAVARAATAADELNEIRGKQFQADQAVTAAQSKLDKMQVTSPVDGTIISSTVNSDGDVVTPGQTIMDILPTTAKLGIEARLEVDDIESVKVGMPARVRFSGLNSRTTTEAAATVRTVSADVIAAKDDQKQTPYYLVTLDLDDPSTNLPDGGVIVPGMTAEVYMTGRPRTFIKYLLQPILDFTNRAFRET